mgnify:CR=1 FL=1
MPKLYVIDGYQISIWSAENGEPIHVHVSRRRPSKNSTKLWLSKDGYFFPANPNDKRFWDRGRFLCPIYGNPPYAADFGFRQDLVRQGKDRGAILSLTEA